LNTEDRIQRASLLYERAVFRGEHAELAVADRELDSVEADLALARGRVIHGRFLAEKNENPRELVLFERAAELYQALGDVRGEGEALLWIGIFHQVVRQDDAVAIPALVRAGELAAAVGDKLTLSYARRHLGIAEHSGGRLDSARQQLEESTRLREELGFLPGVAANLIGLAYIAAAQNRRDEAIAIAEEAARIATASGASAIARQAYQARAAVSL
jgi:tetratricopeptide (TPR) repeat protein